MKIGIIGLGLIGGSIALECKKLGHSVFGLDGSKIHEEKALDLNLVDEIIDEKAITERSNIIVLAVPVSSISKLASRILDRIKWNQTVFDVGSTKATICADLEDHKKRERFVASHPLAGTEFSGPDAALLDLFKDKKNIICEEHRSADDSLEQVIELFNAFGMQSLFMNQNEHDKHMAYVSHLSHVSAFALGRTVLAIEEDEKQIFNLASTGFSSTVRLAKSSPGTWSSIFNHNSLHLGRALDEYINQLNELKKILNTQDAEAMYDYIEKSNEIKRILNGIKLNIVKLS